MDILIAILLALSSPYSSIDANTVQRDAYDESSSRVDDSRHIDLGDTVR